METPTKKKDYTRVATKGDVIIRYTCKHMTLERARAFTKEGIELNHWTADRGWTDHGILGVDVTKAQLKAMGFK